MNIELIKTPSKTFRWKDSKDNFHIPAHMETRHLFMTLVLIWNHTMPEDARIFKSGNWTHNLYRLGPHYDMDYLAIAIGSLSQELFKREDLEDAWKATLQRMHIYLLEKYNVRLLTCTVE